MVTKAENQELRLKKNIKKYFLQAQPMLENGVCPTKALFAASMDKWSMFCVFNLGYFKVLRFTELKNKIPGISARMLSVSLKKLEQNGIVARKVFAEVPPKVEYTLTPFGKGLAEKLADLGNWFLAHYPNKDS